MNIDINELKQNIRDELEKMSNKDALLIDENGKAKYAILPIERFDRVEEILQWLDVSDVNAPSIIVEGADENISYEEYERLKALIMEVVDKTLKPKAEKLN